MRVGCKQSRGVNLSCQKVAFERDDEVLRNFRSEEFSCECCNSRWRNRRESSEQRGAASVTFLRPRHRKRGGRTLSREFSDWCTSQTSDLAFAVQREQKDQADLTAQLGATSEAFRMRWRPDADLKEASAIRITKQSPDIAGGVNVGNEILTSLGIRNARARQ